MSSTWLCLHHCCFYLSLWLCRKLFAAETRSPVGRGLPNLQWPVAVIAVWWKFCGVVIASMVMMWCAAPLKLWLTGMDWGWESTMSLWALVLVELTIICAGSSEFCTVGFLQNFEEFIRGTYWFVQNSYFSCFQIRSQRWRIQRRSLFSLH